MNIDLNKMSDENKLKIMQILEQEDLEVKNDAIKRVAPEKNELKNLFQKIRGSLNHDDYIVSGSTSINDIPSIELDNGQRFDDALVQMGTIDGYNMRQKRLNERLSTNDIETYRTLNLIHEKGVENFWGEVKTIVESKKNININDCSDSISARDIWG